MVTKIDYKKEVEELIKETDSINFQIRLLRHENQKLTKDNDEKMQDWQDRLIKTEAQIKEALTNSKEDAIKIKCGWTHWRVMPDKLEYDEKETIKLIKEKYVADFYSFVKVTETIKKNELKKELQAGNIELETVTKVPQEKKFEYKFTGGE